MILGLGGPEILIVLVVVLVIFGPKNLPKLGSALGKTVKNVREGMEGDEEDESAEAEDDDADEEPAAQKKSKDAE
ncbi:MAG: twin-arginine translocase TatA/TatE family subunit [Coriobacteriales bacterium]|nr:twin-arginine translocase TatA/TatE family subunit [Coriobacteriales bacterium]